MNVRKIKAAKNRWGQSDWLIQVLVLDWQWTSTKWRCSRALNSVLVLTPMSASRCLVTSESREKGNSTLRWRTTSRLDRQYIPLHFYLLKTTANFAPCVLRGCKNRAHSVSWPEVVKGVPNQSVDCFIYSALFTKLFGSKQEKKNTINRKKHKEQIVFKLLLNMSEHST